MTTVNNFLSLLDGSQKLNSFKNAGTSTTGDAFNVTANTNTISTTIVNNSTTANTIIQNNLQILPEGFGSYLDGILPNDIATSAGAFSATMQQVNNIRKIDIEKFAQVVTSLETIEGLPLTNGTNIPTDAEEAQTALSLVALGTGTNNLYTYSDFFGCMSGLPYDWANLQSAISNMPSGNLSTIYSNLYAATQGPALGLNAAVQTQIDLVNAEIALLRTTHPGQASELNDLYSATATQLASEQLARDTGLQVVPSPRISGKNGDLFPYPLMIYSFTDLLPNYAILTAPNLAAQNLEAISDLNLIAGQSIVAAMRAERNQVRLSEVGIILDDNIPDVTPGVNTGVNTGGNTGGNTGVNIGGNTGVNIGVSTLNSSVAAVLGIGTPDGLPVPSPDIGIGTKGISQVKIPSGSSPFFYPPVTAAIVNAASQGTAAIVNAASQGTAAIVNAASQGGGPIVPGSLAGSHYTNLIPPALNPANPSFTSSLLPSSISVAQAIEQVITCNCDCWVQ
jgi:hypothetical protein